MFTYTTAKDRYRKNIILVSALGVEISTTASLVAFPGM